MDPTTTTFYIIVLIFSVILHEVSHGYAALWGGDKTAFHEGRLTLNPIKHLDLFGSIILPLLLVLSHTGIVFGWAKPVPYNPFYLRNRRWGEFFVAIAGIITNLTIAIIFGLVIRLGINYFPNFIDSPVHVLSKIIVLLNIVLALFNLVPIPPLDGSKILFVFLGARFMAVQNFLLRYSMPVLLFFIIFIWQYLSLIIFSLFQLFTGTVF